jgi:hypothetical protein
MGSQELFAQSGLELDPPDVSLISCVISIGITVAKLIAPD